MAAYFRGPWCPDAMGHGRFRGGTLMPFCTSCGAEAADVARFCTKCGNPLGRKRIVIGGGGLVWV